MVHTLLLEHTRGNTISMMCIIICFEEVICLLCHLVLGSVITLTILLSSSIEYVFPRQCIILPEMSLQDIKKYVSQYKLI